MSFTTVLLLFLLLVFLTIKIIQHHAASASLEQIKFDVPNLLRDNSIKHETFLVMKISPLCQNVSYLYLPAGCREVTVNNWNEIQKDNHVKGDIHIYTVAQLLVR